jgi:N-acetylglucosamine malate deacetylase 1
VFFTGGEMVNLIIAAHPDDEILGCGGLIKKYSQTEEFYTLILTAGAKGRYDDSMENTLRSHAKKANSMIGTKELFFEDLPNQELDAIPIISVTQVIEKYIQLLQPHRVFTHHIGDINKDHQIIAEATFTATRPICGQIVKEVYSYNVPSSTEWNVIEGEKIFIPNIFIDITDQVDSKIEAMCCYESECRPYPHPRSPKAIKSHSNYWGIVSGFEYAEPFKLIRKIGDLI